MSAQTIVIPYRPRKWAVPFHESLKRWSVLCLHRRAGKTTSLVNHIQRSATNDALEERRLRFLVPTLTNSDITELLRGRIYGVVLPTYKQAKLVVWEMLKYFSKGLGVVPNEAELMMRYPNGARVGLFGADNPDSLRGVPFWGLGFDEYSQHPSNIFSEVLSKSLADHLGYAVFAGTIKGKNQLYRMHEAFKNDVSAFTLWQNIDVSLATEEGATIITLKQAIEDDRQFVKKGLMMQDEFDQEWYLSPTAAVRGAVYSIELSEAYRDGRIGIVPHDKALKVHTVWDLGTGKNMAIGFFQQSFGQLRLIDCWQGEEKGGLPEAVRDVLRKPYIYGKHFAPHDIETTDVSTGKTRKDAAETLGIKFEVVPEVGIEDGLHTAHAAFSRLWVDEKKSQLFLDAIAAYHHEYDEKRGMYKDQPYHDWSSHFSDVWRYAAVVEEQFTNEAEQPTGRFDEVEWDVYPKL